MTRIQRRLAFFRDLLPRLGHAGCKRRCDSDVPACNNLDSHELLGRRQAIAGYCWNHRVNAVVQSVTPGYFARWEFRSRRGRELTAHDNIPGAPPVMIVNETLAHLLWPELSGR